MKRVVIISLCFLSVLLFCLTGCAKQQEPTIDNKLDAELEYIEDLIFKVANQYAKGEFIEDDKINWEWIKPDITKINDSWGTLILDLTEVNVQNQDIMDFSKHLNGLLISISEEDEQVMLEELKELYKKVIVFRQAYSEDKNQIQKNKIKSGVLSVYSSANKDDWATVKTDIDAILESYKGLMNDIRYAEENGFNLNKVYVLLEEYKMSTQTQNYDLVRMKYIVTVENL